MPYKLQVSYKAEKCSHVRNATVFSKGMAIQAMIDRLKSYESIHNIPQKNAKKHTEVYSVYSFVHPFQRWKKYLRSRLEDLSENNI